MNKAILIITFSPIQPFIAEARRVSDLFVGSQILVELAKRVGETISLNGGDLIYPISLKDDIPNKLVAKVNWDMSEQIALKAREGFFTRWQEIVLNSYEKFQKTHAPMDETWDAIWNRQTSNDYLWEFYWAAAMIEDGGYKKAYIDAEVTLAGIKRTRKFAQNSEPNEKDSLSGCREALHTSTYYRATDYWAFVSAMPSVTASKLKPFGRERLDSLGVIKRFNPIAETQKILPFSGFPSTSSIASLGFVREHLDKVKPLADALSELNIFKVRTGPWPYDGDFLYLDTLTAKRLEKDYGIKNPDPYKTNNAKEKLKNLYKDLKSEPCRYYAVIVFDGDDMGKTINDCLNALDPEKAHREFSKSLETFSAKISAITHKYDVAVIYNGGDDVLAVATLVDALPFTLELTKTFREITRKTASAGIGIVHHLYPLNKALTIAREAESIAKSTYIKKSAICVQLVKRSGAPLQMVSKRAALARQFDPIKDQFLNEALSSQFAFNVKEMTEIFTNPDQIFRSELERLAMRNIDAKKPNPPNPQALAKSLNAWAKIIPDKHLGNWLILARFIASGGAE